MQSYQISLTPFERAAGRFIATVRRAIQRALAEEQDHRGITQASIAAALGVNRSVIHRQIMGMEDISLGRVGAIAEVLGRTIVFSLNTPQFSGNSTGAESQTINSDMTPRPTFGSPRSGTTNTETRKLAR